MVIMILQICKTKSEIYIYVEKFGNDLQFASSIKFYKTVHVFHTESLILNGKVIIIIKFDKKMSAGAGIYLITETSWMSMLTHFAVC